MKKEIKTKLINQAKDILFPYIDVSGQGYNAKIELHHDESDGKTIQFLCDIYFTNAGHKRIGITSVWFNEDTGKILQYGSNNGDLIL